MRAGFDPDWDVELGAITLDCEYQVSITIDPPTAFIETYNPKFYIKDPEYVNKFSKIANA